MYSHIVSDLGYYILTDALRSMEAVVTSVNTAKRENESTAKLLHIESHLRGNFEELAIPGRILIREGSLNLIQGGIQFLTFSRTRATKPVFLFVQ